MKRFHPLATGSVALLMLAAGACSPKKEDTPPKPKVMASAETQSAPATPTNARAAASSMNDAATSGAMAALPKLGPAPKWELKDVNGAVVRSDQFKGKVVVVDFWATWCPPCRAEIPGYAELQKKYGSEGLVIVGISLDQAGPDVVKQFAQKNSVNYQLVMGDDAVVAAFGGVEAIPTTFIIDRNGQVRDRKDGALETAEYEKRIVSVLKESANG